jgi:hypothetical protein
MGGTLNRCAPSCDRRHSRAWLGAQRAMGTAAAATGHACDMRGRRGLGEHKAIGWGRVRSDDGFVRSRVVRGRAKARNSRGQWCGAARVGAANGSSARAGASGQVAERRTNNVHGGGGVGTSGVGFARPQRMARATRWQSTGGLGENAAMAAMWASVARSGFGASGLGRIRGLGPPRKNDLYFSKTNFYST